MWEITLSGQVGATLWSIPVGVALCLIYDMLRVFRRRFSWGMILSVSADILFFILSAFVTFCIFLIFCSGQIRFYVFLGLLAGFLLCRCTLSRVFIRVFGWIVGLLCSLLGLLCRWAAVILMFFRKIFGKIAIFTRNILKKVLQPVWRLLYNLKRNRSTRSDDKPAVFE